MLVCVVGHSAGRAGGGWGCYVPLADNSTASARGGGEGRAGREIGVDEKIFSARSPFLPCLAEIALKCSRPIVHEQRIWYNACVLPKWEDHREAEESLRVGGGKRFPPPSLFRRLRL